MSVILEWAPPPPIDPQPDDWQPEHDAWRWDDLLADEALKLDMTDSGFSWTPEELREVRLIGRYARRSSLYLDQDNIRMIEKELKLCRS